MQNNSNAPDAMFFYKVSLKGHDGRIWLPRYVFVNKSDAITEAEHYDKWYGKTSCPPDSIRQWEATIEQYDTMPEGILMFDKLPNIYTGSQDCCPLSLIGPKKSMDDIWHKVPVKNKVQEYLKKLREKA